MGEGAVKSGILSSAQARPEMPAVTAQARFEERMAAHFILKSLSAETRESYRRGIQEFFRHAGWPPLSKSPRSTCCATATGSSETSAGRPPSRRSSR
jgi:hypothetical protein